MAEQDTQKSDGFSIFGFEIKRKTKEDPNLKAIVPKVDEDGPGYMTAAGAHFGQYVDIDGNSAKDNYQLIMRYRGIALYPEVDMAIEDIVNESIVGTESGFGLELNMDDVKISDSIKKKIKDEFDDILNMLKFSDLGHDIFRRWYIDGRICFQLIVDEKNPKKGIQEIRPIDTSKLRKIKNITRKRDERTGAPIIDKEEEFFIYQDKVATNNKLISAPIAAGGVKISKDAILYTTSGLLDENMKTVISYLHKALKPTNQLRMMEDSLVLYRLARAPERRIFYVDVGNLPKGKAEEYMKGIMARYRNKLVYDASTGEIKDDRKFMAMTEDFWMPRREGGRGTEVSSLPGGDNLGQIDDVIFFQKKLYKSLGVPISRMEPETNFSLGRSNEITRDELKFQKFVDRLRKRFSLVFKECLKRQLILKNIVTEEDWNDLNGDLFFEYDRDNHFTELKEAELLRERLQNMDVIQNYVGQYFSQEWVMKNVLRLSDDDIEEMKKQIMQETPKEEEAPPEQEPEAEPEPEPQPQGQKHSIDINVKPQKEDTDWSQVADLELTENLNRMIAKKLNK